MVVLYISAGLAVPGQALTGVAGAVIGSGLKSLGKNGLGKTIHTHCLVTGNMRDFAVNELKFPGLHVVSLD